jgi:hypothetical protein
MSLMAAHGQNEATHQALASLYRLTLFPFELFHFRDCPPEKLPGKYPPSHDWIGIDRRVLAARMQQQPQAPAAQPQLPEPSKKEPLKRAPTPVVQPKTPTATASQPSKPSKTTAPQPNRFIELLNSLGHRKCVPTRLSDLKGVTLAHLELCLCSPRVSRTYVWNSLLPMIANGRIHAWELSSLQFLAQELEHDILQSLVDEHVLPSLGYLDFMAHMDGIEAPFLDGTLEQLCMLWSSLVNVGNFAVQFSHRSKLVDRIQAILLSSQLSRECWERVLDSYEFLTRRLDFSLSAAFSQLVVDELERCVDFVASRSVLSLQLSASGDDSSFPWSLLPRRTFALMSLLFHHLPDPQYVLRLCRTMEKLLRASYYKLLRHLSWNHLWLTASSKKLHSLEDFGYLELALMILDKYECSSSSFCWNIFSAMLQHPHVLMNEVEGHHSSLHRIAILSGKLAQVGNVEELVNLWLRILRLQDKRLTAIQEQVESLLCKADFNLPPWDDQHLCIGHGENSPIEIIK